MKQSLIIHSRPLPYLVICVRLGDHEYQLAGLVKLGAREPGATS